MNIKLKTSDLKNALNKAVRGMGNNKFIPKTSLLGINVEKNTLKIISTDEINTIQVNLKLENESEKDMSFAVLGSTFSKLIEKTNSENIELIIEKNSLTVKGNGKYTFDIPADEDGNLITFENIVVNNDGTEVNTEYFKQSYENTKQALNDKDNIETHNGIYFDKDGAIGTDGLKISQYKKSCVNNPLFLNSRFVSFISLFETPAIKIFNEDDDIIIYNDNLIIKGKQITNYNDEVNFPIEVIKKLVSGEMLYKVKIQKNVLKEIIDRMSIFSTLNKTILYFDFKDNGVLLSSIDNQKQELAEYMEKPVFGEFELKLDIQLFKPILDSIQSSDINICYGADDKNKVGSSFIKIETDTVSHIIALVED